MAEYPGSESERRIAPEVLLETATGQTDGIPPVPTNLWRVQTAGQTKLATV